MRTLRPRCSSNMPMQADVRPLPKELTTPPVTKMNLAMKADLVIAGSRCCRLRLSGLSSLSRKRLDSITVSQRPSVNQTFLSRSVASSRFLHATLPIELYKMLVILIGVDAQPLLGDDADLNHAAARQHAQLFQFFQLLQRFRRLFGQVEQKIPAISIDAEMLQKAR